MSINSLKSVENMATLSVFFENCLIDKLLDM